eukprot:scaffold8446_cov107-Isochrysis_galbana.AAC.2
MPCRSRLAPMRTGLPSPAWRLATIPAALRPLALASSAGAGRVLPGIPARAPCGGGNGALSDCSALPRLFPRATARAAATLRGGGEGRMDARLRPARPRAKDHTIKLTAGRGFARASRGPAAQLPRLNSVDASAATFMVGGLLPPVNSQDKKKL